MGSLIEINDTLKVPTASLPAQLEIGPVYAFELAGRRLYHLTPTRVFLVREVNGKWDCVGHALIIELTIDPVKETTRGKFIIKQLYDETQRRLANLHETPAGRGYEL